MSFKKVGTPFKEFVDVELWKRPGDGHNTVVVRATDSVAGLLYDVRKERALLVRQPRATMIRDNNPQGMILECVAGRFDVDLGPKALLVKEAFEEAGVVITEDDVELLNNGVPMALSAGVLTERAYLGFAEIETDKLVGDDDDVFGAEGEGETIQHVWIPVDILFNSTFEDVRVMALVLYLRLRLMTEQMNALTDQLGI